METKTASKKSKVGHRILSVLGIILCVIFGFLLVCNLTIIIKGTVNPDQPPSVFGSTPMVVLSGSMSGDAEDHIEVGDLIIVGKANIDALKKGDVIAYMEKGSTSVVTHRIIDIKTDGSGNKQFVTKGDANNSEDAEPVSPDRIVGIYKFRIPKMGDFALFLQKPLGMIIFIGVPVCAFIIYDIIRRQRRSAKDKKNEEEMQAEIDRLRAEAGKESDDAQSEKISEPEHHETAENDTSKPAETEKTVSEEKPVSDEDKKDQD